MSPQIFVFGNAGFGGELEEVELEFSGPGGSQSTEADYGDMKVTYGFGGHFEYPVHTYFTLGGRASLLWYQTEAMEDDLDIDRLMVLNINVAPKARLPIAGGDGSVYATIPVGPSLNFPNDDLKDSTQGTGVEYKTGVSWNISALAGVSYKFSPNAGIFAEGGLYSQNINLKASGDVQGQEVEVQQTGSFSQFALLTGAVISF